VLACRQRKRRRKVAVCTSASARTTSKHDRCATSMQARSLRIVPSQLPISASPLRRMQLCACAALAGRRAALLCTPAADAAGFKHICIRRRPRRTAERVSCCGRWTCRSAAWPPRASAPGGATADGRGERAAALLVCAGAAAGLLSALRLFFASRATTGCSCASPRCGGALAAAATDAGCPKLASHERCIFATPHGAQLPPACFALLLESRLRPAATAAGARTSSLLLSCSA
jgi:hypothetical protein